VNLMSIMYGGHHPHLAFFNDKEYQALFDELKVAGSPAPAEPPTEAEQTLHVAGTIGPGDRIVSISTGQPTAGGLSGLDDGSPFRLVLGVGTSVTAEYPFALYPWSETHGLPASVGEQPIGVFFPEEEYANFDFTVPYANDTEWVEIARDDQALWRLDRSAAAPTVHLDSPNGRQSFGPAEDVLIEWTADDPDGDDLCFSVAYSPDNGTSWYPIISGLRTSSYLWNTGGSPGGRNAFIRVRATDGFHSGEDQSDIAFSVAGKPPVAAIYQPTSGSVFLEAQPIPLRGTAFDLEDGIPSAKWTVLSNTMTTTTAELSTLIGPVAPGAYMATLEARDGDGQTMIDEVRFIVLSDSDRDGMSDDYEGRFALDASNPEDALGDGDGDGLVNFDESRFQLDPWNRDTDGDGWSDWMEVRDGSNPHDPRQTPTDVTRVKTWGQYR
jgi:hypothetical protein